MRLNRVNSAIDRNERNKINDNFDIIERGFGKTALDAQFAVEMSDEAKRKAESVQTQFNQVVIEGDSSVEAAQARVGVDDTVYDTLKARLDAESEQVTSVIQEEINRLETEKAPIATVQLLESEKASKVEVTASITPLAKKTEVEAAMLQRATIAYVDARTNAMASGTPKLVVANISNLPTVVGETDEKLAIVTANNHKYWWNGTIWVDGGLYETTTVAEGSVDTFKLQNGLAKAFNIFPHWSDFGNQTHNMSVGLSADFTYSATSGRVNHIDVVNGTQNLISKKVNVQGGSTLHVQNTSAFKVYMFEINASNEIIKVSPFFTNGQKYKLQSDAVQVRFLTRRSDDESYSIDELKLANIVITTDALVTSIENKVILYDTKNLISQLSSKWEIGARTATIGEESITNTTSNRLRFKDVINVTPNTCYTAKMHNPDMVFAFIHVSDEDKVVQNPIVANGTVTFRTSPITTKMYLIVGHGDNRTTSVEDVKMMRFKLEKNIVASDFTLSDGDVNELLSNTSSTEVKVNLLADNKVYHVGHRGDGVNAIVPENTVESIIYAARTSNYWGTEFDLRASSDGEIIVIHDATVDRTTDGTGNVADMTLAQLKALNIDTHPNYPNLKIPTFDEALVVCKQVGIVPVIHVGSTISSTSALIAKMCESLEKHGFTKQAIVLSDKTAMMTQIRSLLPDIHLQMMLASSDDTTRINLAKSLNGSVSLNHTLIPNGAWVKSLQNEGLKVACWVVDTTINYQTLLNYGVDMMSFDEKIW